MCPQTERLYSRVGFPINKCYQRMKEHVCLLGTAPPAVLGTPHLHTGTGGWCSPESPAASPRCSQLSEALVGCLLHGPAGAEGVLCPQVSAGRPADLTGLLVVHERHPAWGGGGLYLRPGWPVLCLWGGHAWGAQGPACPHPCPLCLWSEQPEVLGGDVCVSSAGG